VRNRCAGARRRCRDPPHQYRVVGRVTTGGYGYTIARSIAYAYLPPEHDVGTAVEVDVFGRWVAGEVVAEPL
jgi:glycine cleavage system aminomethyltransferase T